MNIQKLKLHNFKSITELNLDITGQNSNVICFVGENGSAKTSVLNLITEALINRSNLIFPDSPEDGKRYRLASTDEIKNGEQFYSLEMDYKGAEQRINTVKKLVGQPGLNSSAYNSVITGINLQHRNTQEQSSEENLASNKTYLAKNVLLVRPSTRYELDGMDPKAIEKNSAMSSCSPKLVDEMPYPFTVRHSGHGTQSIILDMFFDLYVGYGENRLALNKITDLLNTITGKDFGTMQITQSPHRQIIFSIQGYIKNLSQGELDLLVTITSIISRQLYLYRSYTTQEQSEYQIDTAFKVPGIVIIDEVDLHLHPRAQEKYLKVLSETFPNIQFIVSTHSPFVIRGLPEFSKAINLPSGEIFNDDFSSMDIDSITNVIFKYDGGFSAEFKGRIKNFKNKLVHPEPNIAELSQMYQELASSSVARDELDLYLASYATVMVNSNRTLA